MKSFKNYLMESVRTYRYKIKIAGDPPKNTMDMFMYNLSKFDPVKIGDPRRTPVQESPYGFQNVTNQPITILDVEFKYPATEPMIRQIARLLGFDENMVRCVQADADDSWSNEAQLYRDQEGHSPLLGHTELEDSGDAAKAASKAYGDSYLSSIKDQSKDRRAQYSFAAGKTPEAFDPFKPTPTTSKSPLSTTVRPGLPVTGAKK